MQKRAFIATLCHLFISICVQSQYVFPERKHYKQIEINICRTKKCSFSGLFCEKRNVKTTCICYLVLKRNSLLPLGLSILCYCAIWQTASAGVHKTPFLNCLQRTFSVISVTCEARLEFNVLIDVQPTPCSRPSFVLGLLLLPPGAGQGEQRRTRPTRNRTGDRRMPGTSPKPPSHKQGGDKNAHGCLNGITFQLYEVSSHAGSVINIQTMTLVGLEPTIPGSVGRCLIHWATRPIEIFQKSGHTIGMPKVSEHLTQTITFWL